MAESELSKNSDEAEEERILDRILNKSFTIVNHHIPLKQPLALVLNASPAAARIQSSFRAHSCRRWQTTSTSTYY